MTDMPAGERPQLAPPVDDTGLVGWMRRHLFPSWGNGLTNSRFQPAAAAGISAEQAPRLELAWAFAFPEAARARSQPAVTAVPTTVAP